MFTFFFSKAAEVFLIHSGNSLNNDDVQKLSWVLGAEALDADKVEGEFIGPRREIVSPWSTNATEIVRNMGVQGIERIEAFRLVTDSKSRKFDPMLEHLYNGLDVNTLEITDLPEPLRYIEDLEAYNKEAGLALSGEEIEYLKNASKDFGRQFTDAELFGFAQINSEHCRHKIFNGEFIIDGVPQDKTLFQLIKDTAKASPENIVSAYKDNVAFINGPTIEQFAPQRADRADEFSLRPLKSVISLKAETHNFPTTVEPFNGASTGSGGEIRDRMGGGRGSIPLVGSAVYMTAYPRLDQDNSKPWENTLSERHWKYQNPQQILTKASNGASDFGNKFGQPLIVGSLLTFEGKVKVDGVEEEYGFDRTIMLAGGVGYANKAHAVKFEAKPGDQIVLLGGDNYRIGMAGGSVSSVSGGEYSEALELSAVQRANPEMQKRVFNVIRALCEASENPVVLIHDHGAGGHINCLSELVEPQGGDIDLRALPVGDPTLSIKEIICNESQERMGLVVAKQDIPLIEEIARRERAPLYVIGEITGAKTFRFKDRDGTLPVDLPLEILFGSSPKTTLDDRRRNRDCGEVEVRIDNAQQFAKELKQVLSLEGVACKDWLTNKVDRSVTGRCAIQQCAGPLQLPLNDAGVVALDYRGEAGIGSSIGHAPAVGLSDPAKASRLSVAEALTNIIFVPLKNGLKSVVLSANWMWPAKQAGENSRLYQAVKAISDFCIDLGVSIPTGKDSLSMTMNYKDGRVVKAPGTVVISAAGECDDVKKSVTVNLKPDFDSSLLYLNLSGLDENPLGGSSYAQTKGVVGNKCPDIADTNLFIRGFSLVQDLVKEGHILAGHDISAGGLITTLCEMAFGGNLGIKVKFAGEIAGLFSEKPGVVIQVRNEAILGVIAKCESLRIPVGKLGEVREKDIEVELKSFTFKSSVPELLKVWYRPSYLLDLKQTAAKQAESRFENCCSQPLDFKFPNGFIGGREKRNVNLERKAKTGVKAAIIREKGTNGDREMAFAMHCAGFDVKDITMWDLMSGHENLEDLNFIVFPGGFSNSDVLGSAIGWAGGFKFNSLAYDALRNFYARNDTMSLGVCNGCQLAVALDLIYPEHDKKVTMNHNLSGKFESIFLAVDVQETNSIMLKPLVGARLGIWVAHGEGRFSLPLGQDAYDVPLKYVSDKYPANPNGSDFNTAAIVSKNGRHLAMMPHLERAIFPWQWAYYAYGRNDQWTPWIDCFVAACDWVTKNKA